MPRKFGSWFKSIESSAKDRLSGLESFIQAIFNTPSLFTSFEVQNFLGIDSHMEALHPVAADLIEGTLYIKLIEARNLPIIESGSAPSSYAEQYIVAPLKSKQRAGVIRSATYSGSTHPKWFEESVFSIRDRRLPMRLQVWDSKFIISDKLLSHIQMDLRSLQPHQLYDIWLPLIVRVAFYFKANRRPRTFYLTAFLSRSGRRQRRNSRISPILSHENSKIY
jgi:hypothetical protein